LSETPAPRSLAAPAARAPLALAGAAALCAVGIHLHGVAAASVDVPFLDDWDALLGFQIYWSGAETLGARLRLLFDPHNEHLLAVPRALVLVVHGLSGRIDFTWLNLIGNACGVGLLVALWPSFWPGRPTSTRAVAFLPAVLLVAQPQAWTAVLSPTVSISNLGVMFLAAACYAALAKAGRARLALAAACAAAAIFCSANGILVALLGAGIPWLRAPQGAAAPLFQPRYRLYGAVLLALTHLAWVDLLRANARRCWTHAALDTHLLRLPEDWGKRFGVTPRRAELPPARTAVSLGVDAVTQRNGWLAAGSYRLGVVMRQGKRRHFAWTGKTLAIAGAR